VAERKALALKCRSLVYLKVKAFLASRTLQCEVIFENLVDRNAWHLALVVAFCNLTMAELLRMFCIPGVARLWVKLQSNIVKGL